MPRKAAGTMISATLSNSNENKASAINIPIRNLWHMLLYAWNEWRDDNHFKSEVEAAPNLDALLAVILMKLVKQRLRIGLGRDYRNEAHLIHGIRGRVDFSESLKRMAFEHGRAFCRFQVYNANVLRNQIVRSSLARIAQIGEFGPINYGTEFLRHSLRSLVRDLDSIDFIELKPELVRREQQRRHDRDYRLMLAICHLILMRQMPLEDRGDENLLGLDRDAMTMWKIFEDFIANFYLTHLADWSVIAQPKLKWNTEQPSQYLPSMNPDLLFKHETSGKVIVLDTKFYRKTLGVGRWGNLSFQQSHLYQMYAYLRSQEEESVEHRHATGILLYPTVQKHLSESIDVQGHAIRCETVDLTMPWEEVETRLLNMVQTLR